MQGDGVSSRELCHEEDGQTCTSPFFVLRDRHIRHLRYVARYASLILSVVLSGVLLGRQTRNLLLHCGQCAQCGHPGQRSCR